MSEPFVMKATLAMIIIGAGLALLIWNRRANNTRDSGREGDLDDTL